MLLTPTTWVYSLKSFTLNTEWRMRKHSATEKAGEAEIQHSIITNLNKPWDWWDRQLPSCLSVLRNCVPHCKFQYSFPERKSIFTSLPLKPLQDILIFEIIQFPRITEEFVKSPNKDKYKDIHKFIEIHRIRPCRVIKHSKYTQSFLLSRMKLFIHIT